MITADSLKIRGIEEVGESLHAFPHGDGTRERDVGCWCDPAERWATNQGDVVDDEPIAGGVRFVEHRYRS